jgi:5-methyltetrahydrofolate--homocysteine methyltransferase
MSAKDQTTTVGSAAKTVTIGRDRPTVIIGERINPTGRKRLQEALAVGDFELVKGDALAQVAAGAAILDVNAGLPGADEPALLTQCIQAVTSVTDVPLCIDTANPRALAAALEAYEGKALVNSVNGEARALAAVLPIVKDHGAAVIGLCMDDHGIPDTAEKRLGVAEAIINRAGQIGIPIEDVVIDPLALTMGADSNAGLLALNTIRLVVERFGVNVTMGASNISFGMPDRARINITYNAMAIMAGMTCPITNPLVPEIVVAILAADLALGRDDFGARWIKAYRKRQKAAALQA